LVNTGLTQMRGATSPRLQLELICARVLLPAAYEDERSTQARLDRLERQALAGGLGPAAASALASGPVAAPPAPAPASAPVAPPAGQSAGQLAGQPPMGYVPDSDAHASGSVAASRTEAARPA